MVGRRNGIGCGRSARLASVSLSSLVLALGGAGAVHAQEAGQAKAGTVDEVVVTGSRVARSTFVTPNPVTVVDNREMEKLALTNVGDVVAQLPQNSNFVSSANVGAGNFNIGAQLANLRGLNPFFGTRTLTLVDTRRVVPTTTGGAVDLNVIPSLLVARTEVVTGGASAVYGSDAVAGVVNVILDTRLQGLKAQVDYGQTFRDDGKDVHVSAAGGTDFAGGRGHIVVGGEYERDGGIGNCSQVREWCAASYGVFTNAGFASGNGAPHYVIGPGAGSLTSLGGVFLASPFTPPSLANRGFNAAGTALADYDPGNFSAGAGGFTPTQGGDSVGSYDYLTIRPEVKHYSLLSHATFDLTDRVQAFVEGAYSHRSASNVQAANGALGFPIDFIYSDNAYLPAAAAVQFGPFPFNFVPFNRSVANLLPQTNDTTTNIWRVAAGLKGDLWAGWRWDAYYAYGRNRTSQRLHNDVVNDLSAPLLGPAAAGSYDFFSWATDAVHAVPGDLSSPIVCRATAAAYGPVNPLAAGCKPLNLFGLNNADPAALAYAYRTLHEDLAYQQHVVSGSINGDLYQGWGAGPIRLAAGGEYRHENGEVTHDLANQPWYHQYLLGYGEDYAGKVSVLEGFAELNVPVLRDLPFARYLELDGAVRQTRTKTTSGVSGDSKTQDITSWKISGIYDVTDWLRLRATRSRDVRAASFQELYSQTVATGGLFGTVTNPWTGNPQDAARIVTGSNFALSPERADTTTVGVVLSPHGLLAGFHASADWYQIRLNDAIAQLGAQNIVGSCFSAGTFCDLLQGVSDGAGGFSDITGIANSNVNLAGYVTRGVDFEADYTLPLDRFDKSWNGSVNVRVIASYLYDMLVDSGSGAAIVNYAGQTGPTAAFGNFNTSPKWQGNAFVSYSNGPFTGTVQVRYIGPGRFETIDPNTGLPVLGPGDAGYSTTYAASISDNTVSSAVYVNLAASYRLSEQLEVFGAITNLFDKTPAIAPGGNGYPTNPVYFDTYGASWKAGVRLKY